MLCREIHLLKGHGWVGGGPANLYSLHVVVSKVVSEKVHLEDRPEGREAVSQVAI